MKILTWSGQLAQHWNFYYLLLPAAMVASVMLVKYLAPEAKGHGTEKVIEAIHKRSGKINPMVVPVKLAATIITLAAGGSVGKEGPCAQIGAGLSSMLASMLKLSDQDRKKLVICGISAGFASVFGTPVSGAFFGIEVLFAGAILYDVLLPSFVAGITAFQVAQYCGITYFYQPLKLVPVFSEVFFLKVILAGVFFGLCSGFLIATLRAGGLLASRMKVPAAAKAFVGGSLVAALAFFVSTQYLGLGTNSIEAALEGTSMPWYAFILKSVCTSLTLSFGGSGGIVTPIFFVGAAAGGLFATVLGLDVGMFSAIGLVSLLAGAANTPISASIMAVELFGPHLAPYATVACIISFLMTGHRSVYPSQILAIHKSASLEVKIGKELDDRLQTRYKPRERTLIGLVRKILKKR